MLEQPRGSDEHMDHAQGELRDRFPFINGWQDMSVTAHRAANVGTPDSPWVQVMHIPERQHWILASTAGPYAGFSKGGGGFEKMIVVCGGHHRSAQRDWGVGMERG